MTPWSRDCTVPVIRVAALYDIHGNLPALEAALAELEPEQPDLIVCGGDVVPGPMPIETIERLRGLGDRVRYVMGNGDREVLAAYDAGHRAAEADGLVERWRNWVAEQLGPEHRDFLASFAPQVRVTVEDLGVTLFCHGSPRSDEEIITTITADERLEPMLDVEVEVVVCGHTHAQFDRRTPRGKRVINAGAVGMPYEGRPGAYWLLLGPEVSLRRSDYDVDVAVQRMSATGFPELAEMLKESLLEPLPQAEVAEIFERQATEPHGANS
jgi:predicted phosphodiesterase